MLTLDKIYHASYTLKKVIRPTDLIYAPGIKSDGKIYLKTENLQVALLRCGALTIKFPS